VSQEQLIILCLRIVVGAGILSVLAFVVQYTRLAPWWRNEIGRTLVVKDILLILLLIPSLLSLFFRFSRLTSHVAAWTDIALIGALTPVMLWRIRVWHRVHNRKGAERADDQEGGTS
jgi:hypothetical protein